VVEIEGADADRVVSALNGLVTVRLTIRTARGYRVGITGSRDGLTQLAGLASRLVRFAVRPVTLDDVYFARTQGAASMPSARGAEPA
jgi:hypothetical protein